MTPAKTQPAQPRYESFRKALEKLDDYDHNFQRCRDLGHTWTKPETRLDGQTLWRAVECRNCSTTRLEGFDRWGYVIRRSYTYPKNYLLKAADTLESVGMDRIQKAVWRGLVYLRAVRETEKS